jgi:hypothetical protein
MTAGDVALDSFFKQRIISCHSFAISPRNPREFFFRTSHPPKSEGAGNAGRPMRPQPRVVCSKHAR